MSFWIYTTTTVNPLYNHALGDHLFFFLTQMNCDYIVTFHINLYKIVIIGKKPYNITLYARINVSIV